MSTADDKLRKPAAPLTEQERANVAHHLNNALAVILGNAQVALLHAQGVPKVTEHLQEILAAGNSARDMIRKVLTLPPSSPPNQSGTHQLSLEELRRAASVAPAGARLLYIDDEEALVMLAIRHLKRIGYEVVGTTSAQDALAKFQSEPHSFTAVMTDLNMPGMSGMQLAAALLEVRADVPVIIASGFVDDELCAEAARIGVRSVVYKPTTVEELAELVHSALTLPNP